MRIGYAVLNEDELELFSVKTAFEHIVHIDKMYIDYGEDRSAMEELFSSLQMGDVVLMQSEEDCGMDKEEQKVFRERVLSITCDVLFFAGETSPLYDAPVITYQEEPVEEVVAEKKRGRKQKAFDHELFVLLRKRLLAKAITKKEMATQLGISYPTLEKALKAAE